MPADHWDVYFNMWRLAWFAHALASAPSTIFDGNIFYPEPHALTFSDAMVVEGLVAAPLLWAGVRPVLVHNSLLLGAVIVSAAGMFVLVERLTRNRAAAVIAGIIFAFAPYRFDHYMHMELQWTVWVPWALWAVHRTIESGRLAARTAGWSLRRAADALERLLRHLPGNAPAAGCRTVAAVSPKVPGAAGRSARSRSAAWRRRSSAAFTHCRIWRRARQVGRRPTDEIGKFSAQPRDYLVATPDNRIYGDVFDSPQERRLFPGIVAVLLAIAAVFPRPRTRAAVVYLIALVAAFEMSLGFHGYVYRLPVRACARVRGAARSRPPRHLRDRLPGNSCGAWLCDAARCGSARGPSCVGGT